jgi:hypothetical protein
MIRINNYDELLQFIKKETTTAKQVSEVVTKALKVVIVFEHSKDDLIKMTEAYIQTWIYNNSMEFEKPIFLEQLTETFNVKDVFKPNKN